MRKNFFWGGCPNVRWGGGSTWLGQNPKFFQKVHLRASLMLLPCLLLPPSSSPHAHHALRLLCSTIHIPIPTTLSILDVWIFFIEICPSSHIPSPSATNLSAKKLLQQLKHSQSSGSKSLLKNYIFIDIVSEGTTFCFRLFVPIFGTHEHTHSGLLKGYLTQTGEFSVWVKLLYKM